MRPINELIWHCTATPEGREVSVKEIDAWHKARGWSGIGYHLVVHLDGSVSEGRPIETVGAHVEGHNTGTIGYVYVGGTDAKGVAKDTRTNAQKATMLRLTTEAVAKYGLKKISGHYEYSAKACPCFSPSKEYGHLIGKVSVSAAPTNFVDTRLRYLQTLLKTLNYDIGMADGIFGPRTKAGIMKFQADNKLQVTGAFNDVTVAKLRLMAENRDKIKAQSVEVEETLKGVVVTLVPMITPKSLTAAVAVTGLIAGAFGYQLPDILKGLVP